ncbi:MAG: dihydrolipoamide acetyltransferase family protein [Chloroflexota bacterium]|nr:dihydrolipoamide acetyltransferase family protein [Chloroflexota bacterium]MXW28098.1 2-oxo acid dehydrogenase subunit E2 [Chloroflexota bacterium]MYC47797.1 2-oxo acid dehydrogenase subunit E2 [Chloroflexota bacterium]
MATPILMPLMGITMEEGIITRWLVDEGANVAKGDVVLEFETDKINAEVEAPADGILAGITAGAGEAVKVQGVCAWVLADGESVPDGQPGAAAVAPPPEPEAPPEPQIAAPAAPPRPGGRVFASPLARRLAREASLELAEIRGSGPSGRIVADDVRAHLRAAPAPAAPAPPSPATPAPVPVAAPAGLPGRRRVIAERMMASLSQSAQVTLNSECDAGEFVALRSKLAGQYEAELGFRISYNDLLVRICARVLVEQPNMQSQIRDGELFAPDQINVGLAVDAPDGLVVPNLKDVAGTQLLDVARGYRELFEGARNGTLGLDQVTGGTFTITNLGAIGVDTFTPVLNPPEAAILGVGRIVRKPVVSESGDLVAGTRMSLSLTFDHRLNDGAAAARFLQRIGQYIEQPYLLI